MAGGVQQHTVVAAKFHRCANCQVVDSQVLVTDTLLAVETVPRDGLLDLPRATADANNPGALEGTGGRGGATCPDPVKS